MSSDKPITLESIRQDLKMAADTMEGTTDGPWRWEGYLSSRQTHVMGRGAPGTGGRVVMDWVRWGMQGAAVRFRDAQNLMSSLEKWAITKGVRDRLVGVDHPDARFVVESRTIVPTLAADLALLLRALEIVLTVNCSDCRKYTDASQCTRSGVDECERHVIEAAIARASADLAAEAGNVEATEQ